MLESYKAENADEIVRLRLSRLKSVNLCKKLIEHKLEKSNADLDSGIISSKALGLSSAIESAIGYLEYNSNSLNSKILSRYYFMLQLTIAEQVSNIDNTDDLASVQKHTEQGHGLGTIRDESQTFPEDYYAFSKTQGHFSSYMESLGYNPKEFSFDKRPREFEKIQEKDKLISIDDLFRRIPELNNVIEEYTGKLPLSFQIKYSKNNRNDLESPAGLLRPITKEDLFGHINIRGSSTLKGSTSFPQKTAIITFKESSQRFTVEYLQSLGLALYDFDKETDPDTSAEYICAKFGYNTEHWYDASNIYVSSYCPTSLVTPLWGKVADPVIFNFVLLYTLSIIVRYLPDLWFEITSGKLDHYGSLIEYYITVIDHVLPLQMLQKITGSRIEVHQPGSWFGSA